MYVGTYRARASRSRWGSARRARPPPPPSSPQRCPMPPRPMGDWGIGLEGRGEGCSVFIRGDRMNDKRAAKQLVGPVPAYTAPDSTNNRGDGRASLVQGKFYNQPAGCRFLILTVGFPSRSTWKEVVSGSLLPTSIVMAVACSRLVGLGWASIGRQPAVKRPKRRDSRSIDHIYGHWGCLRWTLFTYPLGAAAGPASGEAGMKATAGATRAATAKAAVVRTRIFFVGC